MAEGSIDPTAPGPTGGIEPWVHQNVVMIGKE